MNITLRANVKGSAPVYAQTVEVTGHASGVDVTVPRAEGTISKESAVEFGRSLIAAAGGEQPSVSTAPTSFKGWTLRGDTANGFELFGPSGDSQHIFRPVTEVVKYQ